MINKTQILIKKIFNLKKLLFKIFTKYCILFKLKYIFFNSKFFDVFDKTIFEYIKNI